MRRLLQGILCVIVLLALIIPSVRAVDLEEQQRQSVDVSGVETAAPDVLQGLDPMDGNQISGWFDRLKDKAASSLGGILRNAVGSGVKLMLILFFCTAADSLGEAAGGMTRQSTRLAGAAGVALVALGDVRSLIGLGGETIRQLSDFTTILMPTMTTVAVAGGAAASAPVQQGITLLCSNLLIKLIYYVLLPLTWAYAAGSVANAALDGARLQPLCKLLQWAVKTTLTALLILYSGYITLAGTAARAADTAAMKAAHMAISGMIPVVGGILSDATDAVLSGASVLRNSIGLFGVAGVLGFCLVPLMRLSIQFLLYRFVTALSAMVTDHPAAKLIGDLSGVFALVMAMTGACAVVVLFALIQIISVVVP